jgi:uncharacterized protein
VKFGYAKNETLPAYCRKCPYLTDCWGECPKNRIIRTPDGEPGPHPQPLSHRMGEGGRRRGEGEPGLNYLCRGLKKFFAHAIPEVDRIVADLRKQPIQPRRRL